ncbi:MAG: deoxyribose-phosphate aldolase [Proteobacteria bacterium]|nr:deoxyribose-phosphate aldolase [Pseudomonadota bacterium]
MKQIDAIRAQLEERFSTVHGLRSSTFQPSNTTSLSSKIDHTLLKPEATIEHIHRLCNEALEHKFYSVCVNGSFVLQATNALKGSNVKTVAVVGFPSGASSTESKVFETLDAIDNGAQEIDMVLHIGKLKSGLMEDVFQDILSVVGQADSVPVKVILETSQLSLEEKIQACLLSQIAGAAFVKTSTGFSSGGATVEDVQLMKQVVGNKMGVKASGGIKDLQTALHMIEAGADRLGCSNSVAIIGESKK